MNKGKWLLVGCSLVAILYSCKDNPGNLTPQILPKSDQISAFSTDTATIITSMYLKDSVQTNAATNSMLGSLNDPILGESKASIYAEVFPSGNSTIPWLGGSGPTKAEVDSAVLLLQLITVAPYGNNDPQTFAVYQIANNIDSEHAYYSDTNFRLSSNIPIGEAQLTPPNSVTTSNDTFRIKLTKEFMMNFTNKVENAPGGFPNGVPSNWSTTFNSKVIQGVYITPVNPLQLPGQGAMIYVTLNNSISSIQVYYRYPLSAYPDSVFSVGFPLGGPTYKYFNNITHNYATSPIGAISPHGHRDSIPASQFMYVEAMGGVLGRINFPNLYKNWAKLGPVVINEAELNLPIDQQYVSNNFAPPQEMYVLGTGSNWGGYTIPGGGQGTYTGGAYTFNVTQYVQSIIDGKNDSDRGLYVYPGNAAITANRVAFYGAKHGSVLANKSSLTIYYTPLKKP